MTRRHVEFLFGAVMYAPSELVLDTELQLPQTDDSHVGEDVE